MTEPKIYVADLAAYNAGILHGIWIEATQTIEDIREQITTMLKRSPTGEEAEEYAIHDFEGFETIRIEEYDGLDTVTELAHFVVEHEQLGAEVYQHFHCLEEAKTALEDNYHGCYTSLADYAQQFTEDSTAIPKHLELYIDYERMARDWELSGDIFTIETAHDEIHIFSNH